VREANGYVWQQVFQAVRPGPKNDNSDASASQILLVFDALIHGEKSVKLAVSAATSNSPFLSPDNPA
jgi:hypothetical protein